MMEPKVKNQRKGASKSRSGCATCKARHQRCDETKPSCQRCSKAGKQCPGYPDVQAKHGPQSSALLPLNIISYDIPFQVPGSRKDRQLLHYYCVKGSIDLSGYLPSEFWSRLVMHLSHDELAVRQAAIAVSCAHLCFATKSENQDQNSLDIISDESNILYNKSLRSLRKYLNSGVNSRSRVSPIVPLICCVLMYCFETTRGNSAAALQHLNSGIMILNHEIELRLTADGSKQDRDADDDLRILEQVFSRLDLQATIYDDMRVPLLRSSVAMRSTDAINRGVFSFQSISQAQTALTGLQNEVLRLLISAQAYKFVPEEELPTVLVVEKKELSVAFLRWLHEFNLLERKRRAQHLPAGNSLSATLPSIVPAFHDAGCAQIGICRWCLDPASAILRIHFHIFNLLLEASLPYDSAVFDKPTSERSDAINIILDLAEMLSPGPDAPGHPSNSRFLSAETGIVAPLFLLAMKCSDFAIVQRALSIIAASDRREGLYDARMILEIAKNIMVGPKTQAPNGIEFQGDALEYRPGDKLNNRTGGLDGIARNIGVSTFQD